MEINRQTIMDNYAKEQGYEDWENLFLSHIRTSDEKLNYHYNKVINLTQNDLKIKIANEQDLEGIQHIILNTENL